MTLVDVVGSFFDVIRAAIPTEDKPFKATISYITPKGNKFDLINFEIKAKTEDKE